MEPALEDPWHVDPESYKIFNFREQTLKMVANDAPGQGLKYALKNKHQTNFSKKLLNLLLVHTILKIWL